MKIELVRNLILTCHLVLLLYGRTMPYSTGPSIVNNKHKKFEKFDTTS
jgi:hypothetical protein